MFATQWKKTLLNKWISFDDETGTKYIFFLTKLRNAKHKYKERAPIQEDIFFEGYSVIYERKCLTSFTHYKNIPASIHIWQMFDKIKDKRLLYKLDRRKVKSLLRGQEESSAFDSSRLRGLFAQNITHEDIWFDNDPV